MKKKIKDFMTRDKDQRGYVSEEEFIDFYRYISSGIEDDNYFNKMIIGVWGLNNLSSNSRRYY